MPIIKSPCRDCKKEGSNKFGGTRTGKKSCIDTCETLQKIQELEFKEGSSPYGMPDGEAPHVIQTPRKRGHAC